MAKNRRVPTLDEYIKESVNEKLFNDQVSYDENLFKPGDVIIAAADFNETDVNYAKLSDSKLGRITKLNTRNYWLRDDHADFLNAKKGTILGVVLSDGSIAVESGWSINIHQRSFLLDGLHILNSEGKIKIERYNKKDHFQAFLVFKYNLFYVSNRIVKVEKDNIEFDTNSRSYNYTRWPVDELIITDGFDIDNGKGGLKQKIKNASLRDDIIFDSGKHLNDI